MSFGEAFLTLCFRVSILTELPKQYGYGFMLSFLYESFLLDFNGLLMFSFDSLYLNSRSYVRKNKESIKTDERVDRDRKDLRSESDLSLAFILNSELVQG